MGAGRSGLTYDLYDRVPPLELRGTRWVDLGTGRLAISFEQRDQRSPSFGFIAGSRLSPLLYQDGTGIAVLAWVRRATDGGMILAYESSCPSANLDRLLLGFTKENRPVAQYAPSGSTAGALMGPGSVPAGEWHFVAFTHDETVDPRAATASEALYLDGRIVAAQVAANAGPLATVVDGIAPAQVGSSRCSDAPAPLANGQVDGLRIYLRALSAGEIDAIYSATRSYYVP